MRLISTTARRVTWFGYALLALALAGCGNGNADSEFSAYDVDNEEEMAGFDEEDEEGEFTSTAPLARQSHPLGFSVALPTGWTIHAKDLSAITFVSPDAGSLVLVRGRAGTFDAKLWLTQGVLQGEPIASDWRVLSTDQPRAGVARASFDLRDRDGHSRRANGFAMAGRNGATAMLAIAPPDRFAGELPTLTEILYSFRFERPSGISGPRTTSAMPELAFVKWRDPREAAFTIDVPQGWQTDGGVIRPDLTGMRAAVSTVAPGNRHLVWIGDWNLPRMFIHPGSTLRNLGYDASNQSYTQAPYQDAPAFARSYLQQRFGQVQILGTRPIPQVVQRMAEASRMIGNNEQHTAASVDYQLADGRVGTLNVSISVLPNGFDDGALWHVSSLAGFVSASDEARVGAAALARGLSSWRTDPNWYYQEAGANRAAADAINRNREEIAAIQKGIVEDRWASQTRTAEQRGQLLTGTTVLRDPETGQQFQTEAGSRYYFRNVNPRDETAVGGPIGVGQDLDWNPSPGDFRRLLELQVDGSAR